MYTRSFLQKIRNSFILLFSLLAFLSVTPTHVFASITTIHSFAGTPTDGAFPLFGPLVLDGSKFYSVTSEGGSDGFGTIFSINTDGSGYTVLHSFNPSTDGSNPYGGIVVSGSKIYGMTKQGGEDDSAGVIYSINTNGTGYTVLHDFDGSANDGASPSDSLIINGTKLYGTTVNGGDDDMGVVFSINTDGTGFTLLHEFSGDDGQGPFGTLTRSGTKLFGTTGVGGANNLGTIFSINTDGSGFASLHDFAGEPTDGSVAQSGGAMLLDGSTLYGTTVNGGSSDGGTLFKINTDGSGYSLLHSFTAGGEGDHGGSNPYGIPTLSGSKLYGTTSQGGNENLGTLYSINTDGTGFEVLYEFTVSDGQNPQTTLTLNNSTLFGLTYQGGSENSGTIFSYALTPDPTPTPQSSSSSGSPAPTTPSCAASMPVGSPDLFQVDVSNSQAKLYFVPVANANNYFVAFGNNSLAEGYGAQVSFSNTSGVLTYTINSLLPSTTYYVKVRGGNGCMPGSWSNTLTIKTGNSKTGGISYYPTFTPKVLSTFVP